MAGRLPYLRAPSVALRLLTGCVDNATVTVVDEIAEAIPKSRRQRMSAKKAPAKKKAAKKDEDRREGRRVVRSWLGFARKTAPKVAVT